MDPLFLISRILHVALGVFWAGTIVFNAILLQPAVRDTGPDGGKVMASLMRRRFLDIMPAVAIVTIVSGFYLYWRVSGGFGPEYMRSGPGMVLGLGGVLGLGAFGHGVATLRPSLLRAAALTQNAASAKSPEKERLLAEAQSLRAKAGRAGTVVAWTLTAATLTMAIARYV